MVDRASALNLPRLAGGSLHREKLVTQGLIYLFLFGFAAITVFPFAWMVITSLEDPRDVFRIPPNLVPGLLFTDRPLANYETIFIELNFARYLFNSVFIATTSAIGQCLTCSLAGFAFARMEFRAKRWLFIGLLATLFVPVEVTIIPEFLLMIQLGWLDTYLPLIVPSLMVGAFGTFLLTEFFKTIPMDYEEAAAVEGANAFQVYWHVFLPLARPALASLFVVAFITNWNELLRPVLYITEPDLRTVPLALMSFQGEYESAWTLLMAGSVLSILPMVLVYLAAQRYIVQGFMSSGIK